MKKEVIAFLVMLFISSNVYASSFDIKVNPEKIDSKEGENIEIDVSFKDIDMNEEGINTIEGFIKYDSEVVESIDILSENNWKVKYNNDEQSNLYGKFLAIKEVSGITESESFFKLKIRLKDKINKEKSCIILDEIPSNDGQQLINIGKKEIEMYFDIEDNNEVEKKSVSTGDIIPLFAIGIIGVVVILNTVLIVKMKRR